MDDAVKLGIINSSESGIITTSFLRCHVAYISYYALYANVSGSETTLLQKLMGDGSVSNVVPAAAKVVGNRMGNLQ